MLWGRTMTDVYTMGETMIDVYALVDNHARGVCYGEEPLLMCMLWGNTMQMCMLMWRTMADVYAMGRTMTGDIPFYYGEMKWLHINKVVL